MEAAENDGGQKPPFRSLMDVARGLAAMGYKVKKTKIYQDRDKGYLPVQRDGSVLHADVLAYAAGLDKDAPRSEILGDYADRKFRAEIKKIEEQTKSIVLDREIKEGKYILKDDALTQRIDQLSILEVHFRSVIDVQMAKWCQILEGNPARIDAAKESAEADIDEMFNGLARSDTFSIEYVE